MNILQHKAKLVSLGFKCLPVAYRLKACTVDGWPDKVFADEDFVAGGNVSIQPGSTFIDVDLDCALSLHFAPYLLPPTQCVWGRETRPRSHWLYQGAAHYSKYSHGGMLLEMRSGNVQTLAPGSTHPTGELVRFDDDGAPSPVDDAELAMSCALIATCCLVAEFAWGKGSHHDPALGFAGVLARAGVPVHLGRKAIKALASLPPVADAGDLLHALEDTYARHAQGRSISGFKRLEEAGLPPSAIDAIRKWLPPVANAPSGGAPNWALRTTTVGAFVRRAFPPRKYMIDDFLCSCDAMLLYGMPGHGKTLVSLALADSLARGAPFGGRTTHGSYRVLVVDGEMSGADLRSQCEKMKIAAGVGLVASADLQENNEEPDITNRAQQDALFELIRGKFDVVIFDNLFSLSKIAEFISNDDPGFASLAAFASRLRNAGVTVIVVHHGSKAGKGAMGATRLLAPMDLVLVVKRDDDVVTLEFEKHRSRSKPKRLALQITDQAGTLALIDAAAANADLNASEEQRALKVFESPKPSVRKVADKLGVSKSKALALCKALAEKGLLTKASDHPQAPYLITPSGKLLLHPELNL